MIRRPPRSTPIKSSAASDVYKRQISRCFDEPGFLEELKKKSEAGSIQDTYEGRLKKIESIIEGVVN